MDLTTVASVNARRGRGATDDATLLGSLITEVSADAEQFLKRHVQSTLRTEVCQLAYGQQTFRLQGYPLSSISTISTSVDVDFTDSEVLAPDAYYTEANVGRVHLVAAAYYQPFYVQVVYTGGMAATTTAFMSAFPDISGAVESQVLELLKRADKPGVTETRLRDGGVSYEGAVNMLPLLKRRLSQHRRAVVL